MGVRATLICARYSYMLRISNRKNGKMTQRRISHDVLINLGFSILKSLLLFLSLGFAARILPVELLGVLLLSRRIAVMLANALQMGVSQTLIRYIPLNHSNERYKAALLYNSGVVLVIVSGMFFLLSNVFSEFVLNFIYSGVVQDLSVIPWFMLLVMATIFHYFLYSILLGSRRIIMANFFELMSAAGIIFVVLLFFEPFETIYDLLKPLSLISALLSVSGVLYCLAVSPRIKKWRLDEFSETIKTIGVYGVPRGISSFLDISILAILPWVIGAYPKDVSYLILSFTILRILQVAISPITQVLSIVVARQIGEGRVEGLEKSSRVIITSSLFLCMLPLSIFWPWGFDFTQLWLGDQELSQGVWRYLSIISFAILPYTIFYTLRNLIDVVWVQPKNLWTLAGAVFVQLSGSWLLNEQGLEPSWWLSGVFLLSVTVMGGMSLYWLRAYLPEISYVKPLTLIISGGGLFIINTICSDLSFVAGIPMALALSLAIIVMSLARLIKSPIGRDILKQL